MIFQFKRVFGETSALFYLEGRICFYGVSHTLQRPSCTNFAIPMSAVYG